MARPDALYPVCDDNGRSGPQRFVSDRLLDLLEDYFAAREREVFVGSNQFFYYEQGDPRSVVAPDVYVLDGVSLHPTAVTCWKTWGTSGQGADPRARDRVGRVPQGLCGRVGRALPGARRP